MAGESAHERARQAREKAERLQRVAQSWEQGAEGERATAEVLGRLSPDWVVLHDLRWPGRRFANIDHLVIGPGGVFVVDSKKWTGRLSVDGGVLRQNGRAREKAVSGCADAALAVAGVVPTYAEHVHPVLCFVGDSELRGWSRDVMLCSTGTLMEMLLSRSAVLAPRDVEHLRLALDIGLQSATAPTAPTQRPGARQPVLSGRASAAPARRPTRREQRAVARRRKATRELAVAVIGLVAFLLFGPALLTALPPLLTDLFTSNLTTSQNDDCPTSSRAASAGACTTSLPSKTPSPKQRPGRHRPAQAPRTAAG